MLLIAEMLMYFFLLLTLLYCWFRWSHRDLLRTAAGLPVASKTWPILGNSLAAFGGRDGITKLILEMTITAIDKGWKIACFWCGPLPFIAVVDSEDVKLIKKYTGIQTHSIFNVKTNDSVLERFGKIIRWGFFMPTNTVRDSWRITRKHMSPVFHPRNLEHMIPVYNRNSRELVACLSKHIDQGPVNLMPLTMDISLKTVCNLVFGPAVDIDISSPDFSGLMAVIEAIPELFITRLLRPWLRIEVVFRFLYRHELNKLNQYWNNFTDSRLKVAKEISKKKNLESASQDIEQDRAMSNASIEEPLNIVDAYSILQKSHPEYTEADMRYEILMFYTTGTDTLGSATAACLLALAQYPTIQERLYQEVCSVVGPDEDVSLEDLNRMPYLDQVLKETLRWFLIVPYVLRKATKDVKLSTCTIPASTTMVVTLMGIHMDPKIYSDAFKFDPDRFSNENPDLKEKFTYIPFSGGPRNCIAKTYAMQLMKIMVVHVLRQFRLSTDMDIHKLRKKLVVTLISADGYNVHLENREQLTS